MTEPSTGELVRRLDEVARSIERVASTLESSYVRREVYEAKHEALRAWARQEFADVRADVARIEADRSSDKAFRRQITVAISSGFVLMILNLLMAASNFLARVGH
ncbi:MAG: hypothetical protein ACXVXP_09730 [Mycobacteriaceae bacterium]